MADRFRVCVFFSVNSLVRRISLSGRVVFENNEFCITPELENDLFDMFKVSTA